MASYMTCRGGGVNQNMLTVGGCPRPAAATTSKRLKGCTSATRTAYTMDRTVAKMSRTKELASSRGPISAKKPVSMILRANSTSSHQYHCNLYPFAAAPG